MSNLPHVRPWKRTLCALFLSFVLLSLTACQHLQGHTPRFSSAPSEVDGADALQINQFLQKLITAIRRGTVSNEFYESLPNYQGSKPSLVELKQYIQILKEGIGSDILSFTPMSPNERQAYLAQMKENYQADPKLEERALFYWFDLQKRVDREDYFPFILWLNDEGQPTLPAKWVTDSYWMYSQSKLYFKTVETGSVSALKALLQKNSNQPDDLLEARAEATLAYYKEVLEDNPGLFRKMQMTSLRGDAIDFRQDYPLAMTDLDESRQNAHPDLYRSILFLRKDADRSRIYDIIPPKYNPHRFTLYSQYGLLSLHQPIDSLSLQRILGYWEEAFFHAYEPDRDQGLITVRYEGLELLIEGSYQVNQHYYTGKIISIAFSNPIYHLENDEGIGLSQHDVYLKYPFLPLNENTLAFASGDHIRFDFEGDKVAKITLSGPEARRIRTQSETRP